MALALGKDRDEHIRAGHLFAVRRLHMDHRALDDALEGRRRLRVLVISGHQVIELAVDIIRQRTAQLFQIDVASTHDGTGVLIVDQGEQEMFERGVLVMAFIGQV